MLSRRERLQDLGAMEEKHLRILFRVSSLVNSIRELDPLLEAVADQLLQVTNAQRAHVFLCEESSKNLRPAKKKTAEDATGLELASIDRQFTNDVFQSGHPFMSADSSKDDRFQNYQQNNGPLPGTVFCAPLIAGGKTIGVLYADHPSPREKLDESAINLFAAFCNLAAVAIDNALAHQTLLREKAELQQHLLQASEKYPEIVGRSATMSRLRERIALVASSPLDVLIVGESGTGKELVARALHRTGRRATGIFVPLDCGAFSDTLIESELFGYRKGAFTGAGENRPGLLETANGGVIFLDEISSLSLKLQGKILRVLQEREVRRIGETATRKIDVQIIAATNRNLMDEIRKGRFRRDLYYRLNAIQIQLLPLREHMEDVPLLLEWFLHRISQVENGKAKSFSPEAFKFLCNYRFPGNVRELGNIVQNAYYSCPGAVIQTEHLPSEIREDLMEPMPFETKETARSIYEKLRAGRGKFDELVRKPFLSRSFGKDIVREVLRQALLEAEGRYRDAFRLLRISANQYSSMMIFFKRHDCYLDFRLFRQGSAAGTTGTE
jgi:transcriptional regulator with GAF, ATPase, and Fis domain